MTCDAPYHIDRPAIPLGRPFTEIVRFARPDGWEESWYCGKRYFSYCPECGAKLE